VQEIKMKKLVIFAIVMIFMTGNVFGGEMLASNSRYKSKRAKRPPIQNAVAYEAYAVADAETGTVFEGLNIDLPRPQASLTKIMLARVIIDKIESGDIHLTDIVKVPKKAESIRGTSVYLKVGESFTLEELMQAVLIESANDAAYAVAEHAAGNASDFIVLMNLKAQDLGMESTVFHSVNGLPSIKKEDENITTCSDMIKLAQDVLKYPKIREWTSIESTIFRKSIISNHNKLLGKTPEVDGIKTGFTRRAGFNIVATGKNDERRIIVVVLGSSMPKVRDAFAMNKFREYLLEEGGK
jgi:serine-type D-Ala-D-Ala carboxypeptidase (penicillin-binding protein 5/6)